MRIRHAVAATALSLGLLSGITGIAHAAPEGPAEQETAISQVEAAAGYGGSTTPFSVTIAVTRSAGVTSNAGFATATPSGAQRVPA